ncbi:hypothetical protein [Marinagarivorans cellulosilyticus]|uniref:Porin n=1 Tax=Marinagarivorans cellulosilyticus TaxID=2721545 RepID=A0AAN1WLC6_9GAMM|nr:hypothetical protein [Marinagarivorans cellulosilyticus]BCD99771.1 hypothetical protein MARGE09_P3973 [Marinagarivorans cellulosilyticus]
MRIHNNLFRYSLALLALAGFSDSTLAGNNTAVSFDSTLSLKVWHQNYQASVFSHGNIIDVDGQFNIQPENDLQLSYTLVHNAKYLPQFEIQYTQSSAKGQGVITATLFEWVTLEGDVVGQLDLSHVDITAFYSTTANTINLQAGLKIRRFLAGVTLGNAAGQSANIDINSVIPMLDIGIHKSLSHHTRWDISVAYIQFAEDKALDITTQLSININNHWSSHIGYRYFDIDYNISAARILATSQGIFIGGGYHW